MRTLPLSFRQTHDAEHDGAGIDVLLLTITHPDIEDPIRLSSGSPGRLATDPLLYGTVSNGETFYFLPFQWVLPEDGDEAAPALTLRIANFSIELIAMLRSVTTPASVLGQIVSAADPDTVIIAFPEFDLVGMSYDDATVDVSLAIDSLVTEPVPAGSFLPSSFPGLF